MTLVDSSVWIDYFRGTPARQTDALNDLLEHGVVVIGDLILTQVLQGFTHAKDFTCAKKALTSLVMIDVAGADVAIQAAENFRLLRARGITIRKTIDPIIATRCIESGYTLLYSERDFHPFVAHLGLRAA